MGFRVSIHRPSTNARRRTATMLVQEAFELQDMAQIYRDCSTGLGPFHPRMFVSNWGLMPVMKLPPREAECMVKLGSHESRPYWFLQQDRKLTARKGTKYQTLETQHLTTLFHTERTRSI